MFLSFRDNIYVPFAHIGFMCLFLAYVAFIVYNIVTPAYFIDGFFTNPSFFVILKFLVPYLVFSTLVILLVAATLYAYIEIGRYKQQLAFITEKRTLLEVRLPTNTQESLASMEAILEIISHGGGESLWFPVWWKGRTRPLYSFEIISKGGVVFFLINTRTSSSDSVRSAIYAFFPNAQVTEASEYAYDFEYDKEKYSLFTVEWKLRNESPLPIKTYVEFQLEKFPSIGEIQGGTRLLPQSRPLIDPLAPLYDLFGSLVGEEQVWIQYIFRAQKYKKSLDAVAENPTDRAYWKKQKLPEEIKEALIDLEKKIQKGREDGEPVFLSASEKRLQATGTRLLEKQALEVGIRLIYLAPKESFKPARIAPLLTMYKLTNADENSLIPTGNLLEDISQIPALEAPRRDKDAEKELLLQLYRDRLFWFAPALYAYQSSDENSLLGTLRSPSKRRASSVMTTETLVTLCHFPTPYVQTPGVRRINSNEVQPPTNLPV